MATQPRYGGCFALTDEAGNAVSTNPITAMPPPLRMSAIELFIPFDFPSVASHKSQTNDFKQG
jgi:hypothetical protein